MTGVCKSGNHCHSFLPGNRASSRTNGSHGSGVGERLLGSVALELTVAKGVTICPRDWLNVALECKQSKNLIMLNGKLVYWFSVSQSTSVSHFWHYFHSGLGNFCLWGLSCILRMLAAFLPWFTRSTPTWQPKMIPSSSMVPQGQTTSGWNHCPRTQAACARHQCHPCFPLYCLRKAQSLTYRRHSWFFSLNKELRESWSCIKMQLEVLKTSQGIQLPFVIIVFCAMCNSLSVLQLVGGFTVKTSHLKFTNSSNLVAFPFPHAAVLEDLDGSLSGKSGSHILPFMETLPASCLVNRSFSQVAPGSVCGEDALFHHMSVGL